MIGFLIVVILFPQISWADIFAKPADQAGLEQSLANDHQNSYYRSSHGYDPYTPTQRPYELNKNSVSPGASRFNFHQSLKNIINRQEFQGVDLDLLMNQISNSSLMVWQYSSPSAADLYKHLYTNAYLRLADRYKQYEDWEKQLDDPVVRLRKQAIIGCIKNKDVMSSLGDMDQVFQDCFDGAEANRLKQVPLDSLADPSNGNFKISGTINVTDKALDRVNTNNEDLSVVKDIIPKVMVSSDSVAIKGPVVQSRELIAKYRGEFLASLAGIIKDYKNNRTVDPGKLSLLSVFGVPLTEGQLKNIAMLDDAAAYLAMHKIASELAYLKTIDQYVHASGMLDRVMAHPAIEPGYKTFLHSDLDFVNKEIGILKGEKDRLGQYAGLMRSILDEADRKRMKAAAWLKADSEAKEQEGLFKLNP